MKRIKRNIWLNYDIMINMSSSLW